MKVGKVTIYGKRKAQVLSGKKHRADYSRLPKKVVDDSRQFVIESAKDDADAKLRQELVYQKLGWARAMLEISALRERLDALEGHPAEPEDEDDDSFERAASTATEHLRVRPPTPDKKLTWDDMLAASAREEDRVRDSLARMAAKQRRGKK